MFDREHQRAETATDSDRKVTEATLLSGTVLLGTVLLDDDLDSAAGGLASCRRPGAAQAADTSP